ncbi:hypothetical protein LWI28_014326 [Acer negundo]|uniref:Glycosyltransferase n=1 Tax=Acer negundo TaxID=4023 RepID=A0AAD5JE27_ACENE|nr:hypothetical protein LWI28_014326 [Acer negundo]KAK4855988.1 hypothetical protein QYF36_013026 [Acer negundo]
MSQFLHNRTTLLLLISLLVLIVVILPWFGAPQFLFQNTPFSLAKAKWRNYTLPQAASFVAKNGTVIVCTVSHPFLPFLNNWLISITMQKHQDQVLVIAEDYVTLYTVNQKWPGHAVLVPPAPDSPTAQNYGSKGFFNLTSRRPRHLLQLLELGYNVMYNDVDMVWLKDPFPYMKGNHDVYFSDDWTTVKPLDHSHDLEKGQLPNICSCMIYMRPTSGGKLVMKKWIEELEAETMKTNDQPGFNRALMKTAGQVDLYLLPQAAFPTGGLYFENKTWVEETKGMHAIVHNNYIVGFKEKLKRFHDFGLWLVDDHAKESPLGRL